MDETLVFTVDDDGMVLELVRSNADGVFVRENGDWSEIDMNTDQPTVFDLEWLDAPEDAISFWDSRDDDSGALTREELLEHTA